MHNYFKSVCEKIRIKKNIKQNFNITYKNQNITDASKTSDISILNYCFNIIYVNLFLINN